MTRSLLHSLPVLADVPSPPMAVSHEPHHGSWLTLVSTNVAATEPMREHMTERTYELAIEAPLPSQVVAAISDARRVLYERMQSGGNGASDEHLLLLLDTAVYLADYADIGRRIGDIVRDTCEITPWAERLHRERQQVFARITAMRDQIAA